MPRLRPTFDLSDLCGEAAEIVHDTTMALVARVPTDVWNDVLVYGAPFSRYAAMHDGDLGMHLRPRQNRYDHRAQIDGWDRMGRPAIIYNTDILGHRIRSLDETDLAPKIFPHSVQTNADVVEHNVAHETSHFLDGVFGAPLADALDGLVLGDRCLEMAADGIAQQVISRVGDDPRGRSIARSVNKLALPYLAEDPRRLLQYAVSPYAPSVLEERSAVGARSEVRADLLARGFREGTTTATGRIVSELLDATLDVVDLSVLADVYRQRNGLDREPFLWTPASTSSLHDHMHRAPEPTSRRARTDPAAELDAIGRYLAELHDPSAPSRSLDAVRAERLGEDFVPFAEVLTTFDGPGLREISDALRGPDDAGLGARARDDLAAVRQAATDEERRLLDDAVRTRAVETKRARIAEQNADAFDAAVERTFPALDEQRARVARALADAGHATVSTSTEFEQLQESIRGTEHHHPGDLARAIDDVADEGGRQWDALAQQLGHGSLEDDHGRRRAQVQTVEELPGDGDRTEARLARSSSITSDELMAGPDQAGDTGSPEIDEAPDFDLDGP